MKSARSVVDWNAGIAGGWAQSEVAITTRGMKLSDATKCERCCLKDEAKRTKIAGNAQRCSHLSYLRKCNKKYVGGEEDGCNAATPGACMMALRGLAGGVVPPSPTSH